MTWKWSWNYAHESSCSMKDAFTPTGPLDPFWQTNTCSQIMDWNCR
jgi:hypothetical protein